MVERNREIYRLGVILASSPHNWDAVTDETTRYLQDLVRIDTTNPPGNETAAAEYIAGVLKGQGIEPQVLESGPGRGNLIARLKGDGRAAPLLLMAHLDVVTAEAEAWTRPPFSGDVHDGYVWGRGTLDTKGLVAMELMTLLLLKRREGTLSRDIILMANADEEAGGRQGAGWMVRHHPDLIRSEYAINEGGGFSIDMLGGHFMTCQVAEKGTARFVMRTRGRPGHGSQPHRDSAVLKLAQAVQKVGQTQFPLHVTETTRLFFEEVASTVDRRYANDLAGMLDPDHHALAQERLPIDDGMRSMFHAMLHNTVTPTMLKAGQKINVIPSSAEAYCDARVLPGDTSQDILRHIRGAVGRDVDIEFLDDTPALEREFRTPFYEAIRKVVQRDAQRTTLLPLLVTGATDARHVSKLGTRVYGFCPMVTLSGELDRIHGHDERLSVDCLGFGTRVLYDLVSEFTTK